MRVLVACEFSGIVRDAFRAKGHDAWSCDLLPTESTDNFHHISDSALKIMRRGWDLMIAHPPCTYLTTTRNRYFQPKYHSKFPNQFKDREKAVLFFMRLINSTIPKICVENPIGIMSTRYRKPDQIIQPYQFGHEDRKSTCLWLKGLPLLKPTKIVKPIIVTNRNGHTASASHDAALRLKPDERWKFRSRTYKGVAKAMAEQWGALI